MKNGIFTEEQLKKMDGEPVWVVNRRYNKSSWALAYPDVVCNRLGYVEYRTYGNDWVAYPNKTIEAFDGEYFFLSNFYVRPVTIDGVTYTNTEAAFHAFKCPERAAEFTTLGPTEAKRLGRSVNLRPDWEQIKYHVMYVVVHAKFTQHEDLKQKLLATGNAILEEGNTWHDKYWGVDATTREGENMLGKILMEVRDTLRAGIEG